MPLLRVVAAAVVERGRLLVVSKKAAPNVFYLPGGKPEQGEDLEQTLARELGEELQVAPVGARLLGEINEIAAIERVPMRMTVFITRLDAVPHPAAELAAPGWTSGNDEYAPLLAPAVGRHVIPLLRAAGRLPGWLATALVVSGAGRWPARSSAGRSIPPLRRLRPRPR